MGWGSLGEGMQVESRKGDGVGFRDYAINGDRKYQLDERLID